MNTRKPVPPAARHGHDPLPDPVGRKTPRRLRRAAEILAAARATFLEKGFDRSSVGEIAAKVGVVEGLVYSYYPTKRDLLNAVLGGMYEPLIADIEASFSRLTGFRSRLRFLVWRHLRVYVEEPNLSRLVLHEVRTGPEYFKSVLHDLHVRYTAFLMRTVREAVADGEIPADTDAEMLRSMVYGGIEHRMWGTLFGRGTIDVEATADRFTRMIVDPLAGPGAGVADDTPATADPRRLIGDLRRRLDSFEQALDAPAPRAPRGRARHGAPSRKKPT